MAVATSAARARIAGVTGEGPQGAGERRRRELVAGERRGAGPQGAHAAAPVRLVGHVGHDDLRHARPEGGRRGAGAAVVDDARDASEQPVVRDLVEHEHAGREG